MVSNVGFKNTIDEDRGGSPRKKGTSPALMVAFGLLALSLGAFGGLKLWKDALSQESLNIDNEIAGINANIQKAFTGDVSNFIGRAQQMEKGIYKGYDANDVLGEIERIMIKKDSDGSGHRVVLKTFKYDAEKADVGANVSSAGGGTVAISGDADTFEVMAQQIEAFKKSEFFKNVEVGSTDRDEAGRIIFTLTMGVVSHNETPYAKAISVKTQNEQQSTVSQGAEVTAEQTNGTVAPESTD